MDLIDLQILLKPNVDALKENILIYFYCTYGWGLSVFSLRKTFNRILLKLAMLSISKSGFSSNILPKLLLKLAPKVNGSRHLNFYRIWQNNKRKVKRKKW